MKLLASFVLLAVMIGCGGESTEQARPTPETLPTPTPEPAPDPTPDPQGPDDEPEVVNFRGDADEGAILYGQFCALCHGTGGKGDGPGAAAINPKPADHTDSAYMGSLSDQHLYTVIQKGGAAVGKSAMMTPWGGVLTDAQVRDLVSFLRRLSGT